MTSPGRSAHTPTGAPARPGPVGPVRLDREEQLVIVRRLRRTQGQLGGVVAMVDSGRDCADIVGQLSAAKRSLHRTGYLLGEAMLRQRLADPSVTPADLKETEKLFLQLS